MHRVARHPPGELGGGHDVVDGHELEVVAFVGDAQQGAADAAEAVDGEAMGMEISLFRAPAAGGRRPVYQPLSRLVILAHFYSDTLGRAALGC